MRTIPWARLLCEMGTARPFLRWTPMKYGTYNGPFYHKEAGFPKSAGVCSRGTAACWAGRTSGKESVRIQRGYASLPSRRYERWPHAMNVRGVGAPAPAS